MYKKPRLLFICKERTNNYGISTGLLQSSKFIVDYLISQGIDAKVVVCKDSNCIDKEVYEYKPTKVVIHAIWVPPYKLEELTKKYCRIKWLVMVHSKLPFLANEGIAIDWLSDYTKITNLQIGSNNRESAKELTYALNVGVLYIPNIYSEQSKIKAKKQKDKFLDIGCFGAIRPLKNTLIQATAAIRYGNKFNKKIRFHINANRTEQQGDQVLKNLRALFEHNTHHELIEHPWLTHDDFLILVSQMDLGMQVSLSETFNITAADFVYMNRPVVVSSEIEWMPENGQADPNNVDNIVEKIGEVLTFQQDGWIFEDYAERALESYNKKAQRRWVIYSEL